MRSVKFLIYMVLLCLSASAPLYAPASDCAPATYIPSPVLVVEQPAPITIPVVQKKTDETPPPFNRDGKWHRGQYLGYEGWWVPVVATAYSPKDDLTYDPVNNPEMLTANGNSSISHPYGIACDFHFSKHIKKGTEVIIPLGNKYLDKIRRNDRVFEVDDTGPIVNRNTKRTGILHIDLRYINVEDALRFNENAGRKEFCMFVIDPSTD